MQEGFIFSSDDAKSYADIKRRRSVVDALRKNALKRPRNIGEGLSAVGQALIVRNMDKKAQAAQDQLIGQLGADHPAVLKMLQIPQYRRGTNFHPGGDALVGEEGPEIVELPPGAKVKTADETRRKIMEALQGSQFPIDEYDPESQQRLMDDPEAMQPAPIDPRELLQPQSRFDDDKAYQTAELDAFKLMQQNPDYSPADDGQKLTEGQAKTLAYLRRAMFADAAMSDPRLAKAMTRMDNTVAGKLGALGRLYTDDDYELAKLMAEQFSSAILRRDSGAATPDPEVARYNRQYFPLPNETEEQLAAKAALRREEIRALQMSLGNASHLGQQIEKEIADMVAASQKEEAAPQISAEDQEFLKSLGLN